MSPESGDDAAELRARAARAAARILRGELKFEDQLQEYGDLDARDRALSTALLYGMFRWHHRLQWQLDQLLDRPLKQKDVELSALLRLGLYQLQFMRVPDHAAVSSAVAASRLLGVSHARGLVNAVLRRFLREREALAAAMQGDDVAKFSHPGWMIEAIAADWPGDWRRILEANNLQPPMWLRVNTMRIGTDDYMKLLAEAGIAASVSAETAEAVVLDAALPMSRLPGYADGLVSVQDGAAQFVAHVVDPQPGERVLDACAAPGGKSAHMLELEPDIGELWAVDRDAGRLETLGDQLQRLGLTARLSVADSSRPETWWDGGSFEKILVDAPCSALGVVRRHPDIKVLRRKADLAKLQQLQRRLLEGLWPLLAPGGRMTYSTCTVLRSENERLVNDFSSRHPNARIVGPAPGGTLQRLPGEANMDGFFYACIEKMA